MNPVKSTPTKSTSTKSTVTVGKRYFWFTEDLSLKLRHVKVDYRLNPNTMISRESFVLSQAISYQKMPKQCKGCLAVLYQNGRWVVILVWKLTDATVEFYRFRNNLHLYSEKETASTRLQDYSDFYFVNLFHWDLGNAVSNPMVINELDGCLDNALSPTVLDFRKYTDETKIPGAIGESTGKKESSRRRRGKGGAFARMNSVSQMENPWLTIYVDKSADGSLEDSHGHRVSKTLLLPSTYPQSEKYSTNEFSTRLRTFYELNYSDLSSLPSGRQEALVYLKQKAVKEHHLLELNSDYPVRFVQCESSVYQALRAQPDKGNQETFVWHLSYSPNISLPGVCVSMWKQNATKGFFDEESIVTAFNVVGRGYGPRRGVFSVGMNAYFGPRRSNRPRPSPNQGRGYLLYESDYYRDYYSFPEKQVTFTRTLNNAADQLSHCFKEPNDNYLSFVGHKSCSRKIWTSGTLHPHRVIREPKPGVADLKVSKVGEADFFGFGNTPHRDLCDKLSSATSQSWTAMLRYGTPIRTYIERIGKQEGLGLTTTCGYNFIGILPGSSELLAYFCQMQFCMPLAHCIGHQFYGWAFAHCTSLPVIITKQEYHYRNQLQSPNFVIAAWGSGGRTEEADVSQGAVATAAAATASAATAAGPVTRARAAASPATGAAASPATAGSQDKQAKKKAKKRAQKRKRNA